MNDEPRTTSRSSMRRIGVVSTALLATVLTAGVVSAQSASPTPDTTAAPTPSTTTPSSPGTTGWDRNGDRRGFGSGRGHMGGPGMGGFGGGRGGFFGPGGMGSPGRENVDRGWMGIDGVMGGVHRGSITIDAIDGASLSLSTVDGWTRTLDTTGLTITRDGTAITAADLAVGDTVRLAETRNTDGTVTVTGIEVVLPTVTGTVGTVATDSFTITQGDGTSVTVYVAATTTWIVPRSSAPGIGDLTAGAPVAARGTLRADGSMDATSVYTGGPFSGRGGWKDAPVPVPAATPVPSTSPNG